MTKERLKEYWSKKAEIKELKNSIQNLGEGDALVGNDVIMDYRTGYPKPKSVVGVDQERYRLICNRYTKRISELEEECKQIEEYIEGIEDSKTRRIFRMYYLEKKSQEEIGKRLHIDRSRISRKIDDYLKNAHKAQKAQV